MKYDIGEDSEPVETPLTDPKTKKTRRKEEILKDWENVIGDAVGVN